MACNCSKMKEDIKIIRELARKYSEMMEVSTKIYTEIHSDGTITYEFEPFDGTNNREGIIEIIKWVVKE